MTELELNLSFHCCQSPRPPHRHMMGKWKMQVCVCVCVCRCAPAVSLGSLPEKENIK